MSNKSRSRKRKHRVKLGKAILYAFRTISEAMIQIQKIRENNYPKFESGGTTLKGQYNQLIHGGEMILPFTGFKGATPYDNGQYMFRDID